MGAPDMKASLHRFRIAPERPAPSSGSGTDAVAPSSPLSPRTSAVVLGPARVDKASRLGSASGGGGSALSSSGSSALSAVLAAAHASRSGGPGPGSSGPSSSVGGGPAGGGHGHGARDIPACDRCRSFKKKCSRTFPTCTLCANAGHKCSFSTPASSGSAQTHHLRARVEWLSRYVNEHLPAIGPSGQASSIESIETGADLGLFLDRAAATAAAAANGGGPAGSRSNSNQSPGLGGGDAPVTPGSSVMSGPIKLEIDGDHHHPPHQHHQQQQPNLEDQMSTISPTSHHQHQYQQQRHMTTIATITTQIPPSLPGLSPEAAARRFVDGYFEHVNRAYPFVNPNKVFNDLEEMMRTGELWRQRWMGDTTSNSGSNYNNMNKTNSQDATLLYLIMAIGCTTLQRAEQIPADTASRFEVPYSDIIQECLWQEGRIESVQNLVLLALYSLFDPLSAASAWSIAGIAARQAMLLGLSRRLPEEVARRDPAGTERRYRLYWSIYVLDRMMAVSMGMPTSLADDNHDVPLPGLTVDEFAGSERPHFRVLLQTSRHVIELRMIEDRILRQVHFRRPADTAQLAPADRRAVVQDIRNVIEDWYTSGCLISTPAADNVPIHDTIAWLSARYYGLLLLLYYPAHFNGFAAGPAAAAGVSRAELLRLAQQHLQSTSALSQQKLLPLNRVTLCRLFPVGLVLMHGLLSCAADGSPFPARDDIDVLIAVLDAFPDYWQHAHRGADLFRQFLTIVSRPPVSSPPAISAVPGVAAPGLSPPVGSLGAYQLQLQHSSSASTAASAVGVNSTASSSSSIYITHDAHTHPAAAAANNKDAFHALEALMRPIIDATIELMKEVLGRNTCFIFHKMASEPEVSATDAAAAAAEEAAAAAAATTDSAPPAYQQHGGPGPSPDGSGYGRGGGGGAAPYHHHQQQHPLPHQNHHPGGRSMSLILARGTAGGEQQQAAVPPLVLPFGYNDFC